MDAEDCFTQTEMLERGWSRALIARMLGGPDSTRPNRRYPHAAPPVKLWGRQRVEEAEATETFVRRVAGRRARQLAALQAAATKTTRTLAEAAERFRFTVGDLSVEELGRRAAADYANLWSERGEDRWAHFGPWKERDPFRDRICTNYLRHACSNYDEVLAWLSGRVGIRAARVRMREILADVIAERYPQIDPRAGQVDGGRMDL